MKVQLTPLLLALVAGLSTQTAHAQGNLTPPGAPVPTMKTLAQIEPRIDVMTLPGDASSHIIINTAGSYYLSTNLAVTKTYGILIAAAGVTLDLNGFEIARLSGSGGDGIRINNNCDRATVRNGTIRGFAYGISATASPTAKGCLFEKLALTGCSSWAIYAGFFARVIDCRAHDNPGSGIAALDGSIVSGCTVQNGRGLSAIDGSGGTIGVTINNCTALQNQCTYVIRATTGSIISDCVVYDNQADYGIFVSDGSSISGCSVSDTTGTGSSSYGINAGARCLIISCTSLRNDNTNSPSNASQGVGINASGGSTIKDCIAANNQGDGIRVTSNCYIERNNCTGNGNAGGSDGAGIHSTSVDNRIEGNLVNSNARGIDVDSSGSLILRNSATANNSNYEIAPNNRYGPVIDITAAGAVGVSGNSAASTLTSTDATANYSH